MVQTNRIANNIRRKYRRHRENPARRLKKMAPVPDLKKLLTEMSTKTGKVKKLNIKMKNHGTAALTKTNVTRHMTQLANWSEEIEELYTNIKLAETDAAKLPQHDTDFDAIEALIEETTVGLEAIMDSFPDAAASGSGSGGSSSSVTCKVKLPTINLPTFSGDPSEWITFRDMFTTAVRDNKETSAALKMTYLQSVLSGSAAKLIRSMPISDANYAVAWDTIKKRYENKRQLFLTIARKFVNHPVAAADNASSLRSLVDATNEFTRAVDTLGVTDKGDAMLLFLVSQKLDPASRQFWELSMADTEIPGSSKLLEFMEQRARSLSVSLPTKKAETGHQEQHKPRVFYTSSEPQPKHNSFSTPPKPSPRTLRCRVCGGNHGISHCDLFKSMPVTEREEKVRASRLCFLCLKYGHQMTECESSESCTTCKKPHNTLLHPSPRVRFADPESFSTDCASEAEDSSQIASYHSYYRAAESTHALLATALIRVQDVDGGSHLVRAFMDGGSTASFITERCMSRLGLQRYSASKYVTGMGGSAVGKTNGMTTLRFIPHFKSDFSEAFSVEAHIMKKVTNELPQTKLHATSWSHLKNLTLADPTFDTPGAIDIMLGADIFYELLLDGKRTGGKNSLVGTNSKLGWLVAGSIGVEEQQQVHVYSTRVQYSSQPNGRGLGNLPVREIRSGSAAYQPTHRRNQTWGVRKRAMEMRTPWRRYCRSVHGLTSREISNEMPRLNRFDVQQRVPHLSRLMFQQRDAAPKSA